MRDLFSLQRELISGVSQHFPNLLHSPQELLIRVYNLLWHCHLHDSLQEDDPCLTMLLIQDVGIPRKEPRIMSRAQIWSEDISYKFLEVSYNKMAHPWRHTFVFVVRLAQLEIFTTNQQ